MAAIMHTFPAISPDYLLWKQSLPQVMDWHERAMEIRKGEIDESDDLIDAEIKDDFVWNAEEQRFE